MMKDKIDRFVHSRYLLILLIIILVLLVIITGTYAWFTWRSTSNTSLTMNVGKFADVIFNTGNDITTNTLAPVYNYTDGEVTTFSINNRGSSGTDLAYLVKLNVTSIANELKSTNLKYVLLKDDTIVKEGNFSTLTTGSFLLYSGVSSSNSITNFKFYLYIDGNYENSLSMMNKKIVGTLTVEGSSGLSFANKISKLYNDATKTAVSNNSSSYEYDTTNFLMKDAAGNIRYYGASPSNYIYFNCSDYSNQSSDTCETWRIIGVFNGRIKLMRGSQIGTYAWDNKSTSTGAESNNGKNDWSDARLMKLLNSGYESETNGGSLYYDSKSGNCYAGSNNATKTCDFTEIGLKDGTTKDLIAEVKYSLGGITTSSVASKAIYESEIGTTVYSGRPTEWTGKIAIAYPSDYGYAADFRKCSKYLYNYDNSNCTSNNWMKEIMSPNSGWLLSASSEDNYSVWNVGLSGYVYKYSPYTPYGVVPVLYLNSDLYVKSGTGTSSDPYQLFT